MTNMAIILFIGKNSIDQLPFDYNTDDFVAPKARKIQFSFVIINYIY